jgi:hypothetical protein
MKFNTLFLLLISILCFNISLHSQNSPEILGALSCKGTKPLGIGYIDNPDALMSELQEKIKALSPGTSYLSRLKSWVTKFFESKMDKDLRESLETFATNESVVYAFLNGHISDFQRIFCKGVESVDDCELLRAVNALRNFSLNRFDRQLSKIAEEHGLDSAKVKRQFEDILKTKDKIIEQGNHITGRRRWLIFKGYCSSIASFFNHTVGDLWRTAYAQHPVITGVTTLVVGTVAAIYAAHFIYSICTGAKRKFKRLFTPGEHRDVRLRLDRS